MRILYDSVTASNIPRSAGMVGGYVDGRYKWSQADWALFPYATHVPIAVFSSTNDGIVGDCENGDMSPAGAVSWVQLRRASGVNPTIYTSVDQWLAVKEAFIQNNVAEPPYWVAAYPGIGPNIPFGAVAHQYQDVGPYDLSVVSDYWPGVDSEDDMSYAYYRNQVPNDPGFGSTAVLLPNSDFVGSPVPQGVTPVDVTAADMWADLVNRYAKNAGVAATAMHKVVYGGA